MAFPKGPIFLGGPWPRLQSDDYQQISGASFLFRDVLARLENGEGGQARPARQTTLRAFI